MIIFIHGFGSSGETFKGNLVKEYFKGKEKVYVPSLSYVPELAIETLKDFIELQDEEVKLIGSSLGGYYALYLSELYNLKCVLVNPALLAPKSMDKYLGMATNYFDLSKFECTQNHINMLKKYEIKESKNPKDILLMAQKGDEVIDYRDSVRRLPTVKSIIEEGGDHSFLGFNEHLPTIEDFFK